MSSTQFPGYDMGAESIPEAPIRAEEFDELRRAIMWSEDEEYLDRIRPRVGQWVRDTCDPPSDRAWLDHQFEIGRRHARTKKNVTEGDW